VWYCACIRLVAGLLRPRLSFSKLSTALSSGKVSVSATPTGPLTPKIITKSGELKKDSLATPEIMPPALPPGSSYLNQPETFYKNITWVSAILSDVSEFIGFWKDLNFSLIGWNCPWLGPQLLPDCLSCSLIGLSCPDWPELLPDWSELLPDWPKLSPVCLSCSLIGLSWALCAWAAHWLAWAVLIGWAAPDWPELLLGLPLISLERLLPGGLLSPRCVKLMWWLWDHN
jgi:hypothetical protein